MARIELPELFQNGMMLQREKPIKLWGNAAGGDKLTVCFCEDEITAEVIDGSFYCELPAKKASLNQTLYIYFEGEEIPEITIAHISIGDIFIAAGQSNMEFFLRYDAHWNDIKKWERNHKIRMFNCKRIAYSGQKREQPDSGAWFSDHEFQWETFSAPGYSFAESIQPVLGVPVGIIGCNWGGTPACAWMDSSNFEKGPLRIFREEYEEAVRSMNEEEQKEKSMEAWEYEDSYFHQIAWRAMMYGMNERDQKEWMEKNSGNPEIPMGPYHHYRPAGLYEQMVKKIAPFSVKGVLWYQGESDAGHADIYDKTLAALIRCWRELWQDDLPFLFVQLAPFGKWLNIDGTDYPVVRERQDIAAKEIPNTGMISIMDLGMYEDIHPKRKIEVGERLALLARGKIYGENLLCESPELLNAVRTGNSVILHFSNTGKSLKLKGSTVQSLSAVQGGIPMKILEFKIDTRITLIFEALTQAPVEIFFAKEPYCEVNLFNEADLPIKPFSAVCN